MKEEKKYPWNGYQVTENGEIYSSNGRTLHVSENGYIWITIGGKKKRKQAGRIVYEAITGKKLGTGYVMVFLDGDCCNVSFNNLKPVSRKEYFKNYDWQTIKKVPKQHEPEIRRAYNYGTSKKELAEKFGCCEQTIAKIINGTY